MRILQLQLIRQKNIKKEHEFQLIGLIPDCTNTITITATYKDGTSQSVSTNYTMGSLLGDEDIQLEQVSGSKQDLGNGLYTLLGNDSDDQDFVYMYDTNGILRSEIPHYWISFSSYVDAKIKHYI